MARVLYVDDERGNLTVFDYAFRDKFDLIICQDPLEALSIIASEEIGVLLTDQRMPGLTGVELATRCKEMSPETVCIIVTAYDDVDPIMAAVNSKAISRYLIKPWSKDQLEETIHVAIFEHQARKQHARAWAEMRQTLEYVVVCANHISHIAKTIPEPQQSNLVRVA